MSRTYCSIGAFMLLCSCTLEDSPTCRRADYYGAYRYGEIKRILLRGLDLHPLPIDLSSLRRTHEPHDQLARPVAPTDESPISLPVPDAQPRHGDSRRAG